MIDKLDKLAADIGETAPVSYAPVEAWNPEFCGELDIKIKVNGDWYYNGSQIKRQKLVQLFTRVLWRDAEGDGSHYLITPAEKIKIKVEDVAFLASEMLVSGTGDGQVIKLNTNLAGLVTIGAEHGIRFVQDNDQFMAYVHVRYGLEAKLTRALCFELTDYLAEKDGNYFLVSDGQTYSV